MVQKEWMSEYKHDLFGVGSAPTEVEKLVPNLRNKERSITATCNFTCRWACVSQDPPLPSKPLDGALHSDEHRVPETGYRHFERDLYKLLTDSVFRKTMENLRKRVDVKLVRANKEDKLRCLIASPAFARAYIFDDGLAGIQMHKSRLVLNQPVYTGLCVLELSKHLMYAFYHNQMKSLYGERCQLLYRDTDSLLLEIQTEDVYQDMAKHADHCDTSDYPKDHPSKAR